MPALFDSGFCVRTPSWHREETLLADWPGSWPEARKVAGLEWDPIETPSYAYRGLTAEGRTVHAPVEGGVGDYFPDEEKKRIVRSDTGGYLGHVGIDYTLIDHGEMGQIVEALLEQSNTRIDTMGCLDGGKKVFATILLDEPIEVPGDKSVTLPYLALLNAHDGTGSCQAISTTVRVVCANTYRAAELDGERRGTVFSFRHSKGWKDRIEEAREAIRGVQTDVVKFRELAGDLVGITVSPLQREHFIIDLIPAPPASLTTKRVQNNIERSRQALRDLLDGPTCEGIDHTGWGLVQAAGEYADHVRRSSSWESATDRSLLKPSRFKTRAVRLVRELASSSL